MGSLQPGPFSVQRIAIIGAGPTGLAAAKYLSAQACFEHICVFEQSDDVGGVWNYNDDVLPQCPVPQPRPFFVPMEPIQSPFNGRNIFPNAMYDDLYANIPKSLMMFSDQKFPNESLLFPPRKAISDYLQTYAQDVRHLIRFNSRVTDLVLRSDQGNQTWLLRSTSMITDNSGEAVFDAVVVANGHYGVPDSPDLPGIVEFHAAFPSVISHSKTYRSPQQFADQRVVVVGNGPSGVDIAKQLSGKCRQKLLLSVRAPTPPEKLEHIGCEEIAEIQEFLRDKRGFRCKDGTVIDNVDAIIFCTGYFFSYPFLSSLQHKLITDGKGVHGLYKHLFHIEHPTLAFPALNIKSVPWPLAEAQAAALAAVWSNNLPLPPYDEMRAWSQNLERQSGPALHIFKPLEDGVYINEFHEWVARASRNGKPPPWWSEEMFWQRKTYAEARILFEQQGCKAKSLEELGLRFSSTIE